MPRPSALFYKVKALTARTEAILAQILIKNKVNNQFSIAEILRSAP